MNKHAAELAARLEAFYKEITSLVETCSQEDWNKVLDWEQWSVGVTTRHLAAGHLDMVGMAQMMVSGQPLPDLTMDQIVEMANQHAREHADCTREEVLDLLSKNGPALVNYVSGLSDEELERTGEMEATGGPVTTRQLLEYVVLESGGEHLANLKSVLGA